MCIIIYYRLDWQTRGRRAMETEKNWNYADKISFTRTLEEIRLQISRLFTSWSISRNARVYTISGKEAVFDYVMQDMTYPSHIITVKVIDGDCESMDPFIDFIMDSMDAIAWRYLIIVPDEMDRNMLEFCEGHGAIVYSIKQLVKISEMGKTRTSLNSGKCRVFPPSVMNDTLHAESITPEVKNTLANIMKAGRKRRDRSEIIEDILYWAGQYDGIILTRLVYKTNLNHKILRPILEEMCREAILRCSTGEDGRKYYRITSRGTSYLKGKSGI